MYDVWIFTIIEIASITITINNTKTVVWKKLRITNQQLKSHFIWSTTSFKCPVTFYWEIQSRESISVRKSLGNIRLFQYFNYKQPWSKDDFYPCFYSISSIYYIFNSQLFLSGFFLGPFAFASFAEIKRREKERSQKWRVKTKIKSYQ